MQTIKKQKKIPYTLIGIYLLFSPFIGLPMIIKNAVYVIFGATLLWLSSIDSEEKIENNAS